MSAETVYPLYDKYVAQLHQALSTAPSGPVRDAFRVKRLSPSEFCTVWEKWGRIPGLQEGWADRFSAGYEADAESIRRRLEAALAKKGNDREAA